MSADWPGPLTQLYYLILPSLPLVIAFFVYAARLSRTGAVEALDANYTRTAVLKRLPWVAVLVRHVLRSTLLPTITVAVSWTADAIQGVFEI
jgi:peptide/nickel transport system permease protein